ncbi:MAG: alpha-mannosidase, partial [Stackebrandtia sp.]
MHDDRKLIEDRLDRVLRERIRPAVYGAAAEFAVEVWHAPGEPVSPAEGIAASYEPCRIGQEWGPPWGTSWFRMSGRVPAAWAGEVVEARVDLGFSNYGWGPGFSAEGLIYRPDGTAVKGLNPDNQWLRVTDKALGGEEVVFHVEAAANPRIQGPVTQFGDKETAPNACLYQLDTAELAVFHTEVWELVQDLEVLDGLMRQLPLDQPRRWELLRTIGKALDAVDLRDVPGSAAAARAILAPALAAPATASAHRLSAVGHAHIDSAWLWPLRETVRKVARTASNVLTLMDADPGFVFAMSSAQQWAWMEEHRPDVWERMRKRVAEGRLVPVGGMWVESDTNMPGGE